MLSLLMVTVQSIYNETIKQLKKSVEKGEVKLL